MHLIFKQDDGVGGIASRPGVFGLTCQRCGGGTFAHELGHNMGLRHDRYQTHHNEGGVTQDPAYGYVNQRAFAAGGAPSRWRTIMSYSTQCEDAYRACWPLLRFSNSRQSYTGDPMGVAHGEGEGVAGPADAAAVLNATGPAVALWRDPAGTNRRPVAAGTLPDRALPLDATLDLDVSQAFVDPDGDVLSYTVSSSVPSVATVAAAGARLTLTAVGVGTTTVRVTATDPGGRSAGQSFTVTVSPAPNRAPEAVGALGPLTLGLDDPASSVDVGGAFRDPDGDELTYGAVSSSPSVASVSVSGSVVVVTPAGEGTAAVTVTARDPGGLSASQSFTVTVSPAPNRAPEAVGALGPLTLGLDDPASSVDVGGAFRDPDGDDLTYGAVSSSPSVASVSVSGSVVVVTPAGEGSTVVTVTATDPGGLSAGQSFTVTVSPAPNRAPEAVGVLGPLTLGLDGPASSVDVGGAFRDPDGDDLTYGAVSSSPSVASVSVSGSVVVVTPAGEGTAAVTVTARDPGGLSASQSFTVTVSPAPNRAPEAVGVLGPLTLGLDGPASSVDVGGAFRDPDGDDLTYGAVSSSPSVASVSVSGSVVVVTPAGEGSAVVTATATDPGGLSAVQSFTVTVSPAPNRSPEAVGVLRPLALQLAGAPSSVELAGAFRDPDGDELTYGAVSSAPSVASVSVSGSVVAVTPAGAGAAVVTVTATDAAGSNTAATQTFSVRVVRPFTDHPIVPGVTAVKAVHFTELRARIDVLRREAGLAPSNWTDPVLLAGATPVRLVHLTELRSALDAVYDAAGRPRPAYADANTAAGALSIKAAHIMELRAAVLGVE